MIVVELNDTSNKSSKSPSSTPETPAKFYFVPFRLTKLTSKELIALQQPHRRRHRDKSVSLGCCHTPHADERASRINSRFRGKSSLSPRLPPTGNHEQSAECALFYVDVPCYPRYSFHHFVTKPNKIMCILISLQEYRCSL